MDLLDVRRHIGKVARSWEGEKEIKGNMGFENEVFEQKMEDVGWKEKQAWCAYFAELVWRQAYLELAAGLKGSEARKFLAVERQLAQLFSGSAVATYRNFDKSGDFIVNSVADEGAVVIWQSHRNGKAGWTGHAGLVIGAHPNYFVTIEGNTNSKGGREGIEVARKTRRYNWEAKNGLRLKGFIHPIAV